MTTRQWQNITDYMDTVGTTLKTFTFPKTQNFVKVTIRGNANVTYTIGSQSGTLTPGQSISVAEKITSFTLTAASGTQTVEVWATEDGTQKGEDPTPEGIDTDSTVITRDSNGNVSQVQIMDGTTVMQTTSIIRDISGNVSSVVDTVNGKTVTTTINRATDGTVSSTSKAVS